MTQKRPARYLLPFLILVGLTTASLITSGYAWYSVSAPEISVSSSSVLITTASPDYGEFAMTHLYIVEPNIGEVDENYPASPKHRVGLSPVSTVNGVEYYSKYGNRKIRVTSGYYRFVAQVAYGQMTRGMGLNYHVNVSVPKSGGVDKPNWARVIVRTGINYSLENQWFSSKDNSGAIYPSRLVLRDKNEAAKGIGPSSSPTAISTLTKEQFGSTYSVNTNYGTSGTFFIEVTLYIEGTVHTTDASLDEELSISLFVFPYPTSA